MSVQAGIWNIQGQSVDRELLVRISQATAEYGPDGETMYFDGPLGILYRPFHTTPESRGERQPHLSTSGKAITWDGRLDNRADLIAQLGNGLMSDRTDVAVVAAAYERWGVDCLPRIVGDWALSIWDPRERELILSRDYIGIRHLFYYPRPGRILWSNHVTPLALCGDQFTVCDEYVAGYLASDPDTHLTPYQEIYSVPPGKLVRIRDRKIAIQTYWSFNKQLRTRFKTDAEYEGEYRHLFRQAVRRRLRTDSPILAELSGGYDSSAVVCMADDIIAKESVKIPRLDTFSYYDSLEPGNDDLPHIAKIEEKRGRAGFHLELEGSGTLLSFENPVCVARLGLEARTEIKTALSDIIPRYGYRVVLSGSGGDDINGQTLDPRVQMADLLLELRLAEFVKELTAWSFLIRRRPWIQLFFQTILQLMPLGIQAYFTDQGKVESWINRAFARKHKMPVRQMLGVKGLGLCRPSVRNTAQTIATISRQMTHAQPSIVDRRYPYLDRDLVEFSASIPLNQLLRPGQRRSLMRRALRDLLPPEVLNRKTKAGLGRCYSVGLSEHWDKVSILFDSPMSWRLGYVEKDRVREALLSMKSGRVPDYVIRLLKIIVLERWLRDVQTRGVIAINDYTSVDRHWKRNGIERLALGKGD